MSAADLFDWALVLAALWVWPGYLIRAVWSVYCHMPSPRETPHDRR
jgi:hypothetical protein